MTKTPPERKVAIAFIKVFRKNLDDTLNPNMMPQQFGEDQAEQSLQFLFGKLVQPPAALAEKLKQMFEDMQVDFMQYMNNVYDELLPATVDETMKQLESHFREVFTNEELEELAALAENKTLLKLLSGSDVFEILRRERINLYETLDRKVFDYTNRTDVRDRINNTVQEYISKPQVDDVHEDGDGSLDPKDIF